MTPDAIPDEFHVLIVDDDVAFLNFTEALIKAVGVKYVSKAGSGRDAFHLLRENLVASIKPPGLPVDLSDLHTVPGTSRSPARNSRNV